jgi:hypothetical protein
LWQKEAPETSKEVISMGMFEEVVQMLEARKRKPQQLPPGLPPSLPPAEMVDPRLQQEMLRDPTLEQKIREYLLKQRMQQIAPIQQASIGTRG